MKQGARSGWPKKRASLKGLARFIISALGSAQLSYRQHASRFRQHSARSPQQSLAAKARAEADIKTEPTESLIKEFFIMVS